MATLTLKKKPAGDSTKTGKTGERRPPVRGGGVSRPRPTLAQAQTERAERQAAFEERRTAQSQGQRHDDGRGPGRPDRPGKPGAKPGFGAKPGRPGGKPFRGEGPAGRDRTDRGDRPGGWSRGGDDERRFEGRGDGRAGHRYEGRDDGRFESRSGGRFEGRGDGRGDGRGPGRPDFRGGDRGPSRGELKGDPRGEFRGDFRGEGRGEFRGPARGEQRKAYGAGRPDERRPHGSHHEPSRGHGARDDRGPGPRRHADQDQGWGQQRPARRNEQAAEHRGPERGPVRGRDAAARPDQRRQTALRSHPEQPPRTPQPAPERSNSAEGERLSKRMSELGLASRREADEWIAAGWVKVDGHLATLGERVGPEARIEVDPAARQQQAQRVTILLHKPIGYVSGQAEDGYEPAAVLVKSDTHWKDDPAGIKYHIGHSRFLAPAGRLDIDSTGLLVLTQDGRIAKQLIGDDSTIEKEYLVRVEYVGINGVKNESGQLDEQGLALLNHGLMLDDVELKPAKVSWANEDQLRFVLREGRKRQIRRMCELVGLKVTALKRVRIGRIPLGHLPVGQWRFLAPWEKF
ncbi:pseudouridine synthase [Roseateles sp. DB2]|uniref:pseudouridine synthase n=1 Tax=Roseateles sp. DB2 TaxID=3453717 RepID=UPI003EE87809